MHCIIYPQFWCRLESSSVEGETVEVDFGQLENSGIGNQKQKMEMENKNGQNLMQLNLRVKPLINDHLLRSPLYKDHTVIRFQRWLRHT